MSGVGSHPKYRSSVGAKSMSWTIDCRRSPCFPERGSQMNSGMWAISFHKGMRFLPHQSCSASRKPWSVHTISIVSFQRSCSSMAASTRPRCSSHIESRAAYS